jgi:hypothetical protein
VRGVDELVGHGDSGPDLGHDLSRISVAWL